MKKFLFPFAIFTLAVSCNNSEKPNLNSSKLPTNPPNGYEYVDSVGGTKLRKINDENFSNDKTSTKYSFVVIHTKNQFTHDRTVFATDIFETMPFISEDEKYKLLDEAQKNPSLIGENISKREIKTYDSYAEASKARESLLSR